MTEKLRGLAPTDPLMFVPWRDCLLWAIGHPPVLEAFKNDTGIDLMMSRSPLERSIDDATGYQDETFRKFILWFNENIWGDITERAEVHPDICAALEAAFAEEESK